MAAGGKRPGNSDPATTSAAAGNNGEMATTTSSRSSSESSWGEEPPPEATTAAVVKQSPTPPPSARPDDPDAYRIPSEVFSRTKSSPMDWSVASTESLFSINTGNMSFTKDQAFLFAKSGDYIYGPSLSMGGLSPMRDGPPTISPMRDGLPTTSPMRDGPPIISPMRDGPPIISPMRDKPPIISPTKTGGSNGGSPKKPIETAPTNSTNGITTAPVGVSGSGGGADGSTREVIKEDNKSGGSDHDAGTGAGTGPSPTQVGKDPSLEKSSSLRRSSTASVKSFAFPILTGDGQRQSTQSQSQPSTARSENKDKSTQAAATPRSTDDKGNENGTNSGSKLFSCLPCCSTPRTSP